MLYIIEKLFKNAIQRLHFRKVISNYYQRHPETYTETWFVNEKL